MQEFAYFRMLLFMWQSGDCSIPNDAELMGRLTRTDANTCSIVFELAMIKHPKIKSKLTNKRLFEMWEERCEFIESRKKGGFASGKSRKKAGKGTHIEHNRTCVQSSSNTNEQVLNSSSSKKMKSVSSEASKRRCTSEQDSPEFLEFWSIYPLKKAKGAARRAWQTAIRKADSDEILTGVELFAKQQAMKGTLEFVKHPATWLNGECWADEMKTQRQRQSENHAKLMAMPEAERNAYLMEYFHSPD